MTGFNLRGIEPYVDWLNVMTYDLHGSWEKPILAQPHTNLSGKHPMAVSLSRLSSGRSPLLRIFCRYQPILEESVGRQDQPAKGHHGPRILRQNLHPLQQLLHQTW